MNPRGGPCQRTKRNCPVKSETFLSLGHDPGSTTVMMQNIPREYSQDELLEEVMSVMGPVLFDFFYLPWDVKSNAHAGYVVMNFHDSMAAHWALTVFAKHKFVTHPSHQVGRISLAHTQGLEGNLRLLERRSGVHQDHPCEPVVIWRGRRLELQTIIQLMRRAGCALVTAPGGRSAPGGRNQEALAQLLDLALVCDGDDGSRGAPLCGTSGGAPSSDCPVAPGAPLRAPGDCPLQPGGPFEKSPIGHISVWSGGSPARERGPQERGARARRAHGGTAAPQWELRRDVLRALAGEGEAIHHAGVSPGGWFEEHAGAPCQQGADACAAAVVVHVAQPEGQRAGRAAPPGAWHVPAPPPSGLADADTAPAAQSGAGPASHRVPVPLLAAAGRRPREASGATAEIRVPRSQDAVFQKYITKFGAV